MFQTGPFLVAISALYLGLVFGVDLASYPLHRIQD